MECDDVLAGPTRREWGKFHPQYTNVPYESCQPVFTPQKRFHVDDLNDQTQTLMTFLGDLGPRYQNSRMTKQVSTLNAQAPNFTGWFLSPFVYYIDKRYKMV